MNPFFRSMVVAAGMVIIPATGAVAQKDLSHNSKVFSSAKPYRIFLPADYETSKKRYPVIYFFHGNQGSHELEVPGLAQWVRENGVILVAWNGRSSPEDMRPYNVGYHSNIKYQEQFSGYFLEFIAHIDSAFRTIKDRSQRASVGHSMGGFMSLFLAGKFPHLLGTAVSMKGSSEFFVGFPDRQTLYNVKYMFKNLYGVRVRIHNSTVDELVYLNNEVNQGAIREKGLDYTYQVYPGGHEYTPDEFKDALNFVVKSFKDPLPVPSRWHHADLYPEFDIWGYHVKSNLLESGYVALEGVTSRGMRITTRKWQPDGRHIPGAVIQLTTAPLYQPKQSYLVKTYNERGKNIDLAAARGDKDGRLTFLIKDSSNQVGISKSTESSQSSPEIVFVQHKVNDRDIFLDHEKESRVQIQLLNRGGGSARRVKVTLSTETPGVSISNPVMDIEKIDLDKAIWLPADFKVTASPVPPSDGSPFRVRFNLAITDSNGTSWRDEFDAPVYYNVPEFKNIGIDDGDSEIFGSGNGNNVAEPGETVMIYQNSNRTRLYYDDPYVDGEKLYDELQPDKWGDGYALSSLIHISKNCPPGHKIRFLACYEIKEWKTIKRNVTWGVFSITVGSGK